MSSAFLTVASCLSSIGPIEPILFFITLELVEDELHGRRMSVRSGVDLEFMCDHMHSVTTLILTQRTSQL